MKNKKQLMMVGSVIALTFAFLLVLPQTSSAVELKSRGCNSNQICDVINNCDANGCTASYDNCDPCGVSVKVCGNGVVTSPSVCVDNGGAPSCIKTTPICNDRGIADPNVVLTYSGYSKKNLIANVTPATQTGLAGSTLNYKITVQNKNPVTMQLGLGAQIPDSWSINIPSDTSVAQGGSKDIIVRVTSNETASDGDYPIIFVMAAPALGLFGSVEATYTVGSRGAPSINTTPRSQKGIPGQSLMYNVSVTNNDPPGFDASTISFNAIFPPGFNAVFTPSTIKLGAGATGSVRLDVYSASNASETKYSIQINATQNRLSGSDFIEYEVDYCGNNVCDIGEDTSCVKDCPVESTIICNGRCESELDDGLSFSAIVNSAFSKFVICSRNTTTANCMNAAKSPNGCGLGKACLCTGTTANCNMHCVDTKGAYYMLINGTSGGARSVGNYSFACPFVDMPDIKATRQNFYNAKQDYEKAQSALREVLKSPNTTIEQRAAQQPCLDALGSIISEVSEFVSFAERVIAWPGKMNTTAMRDKADGLRDDIDTTYNAYCGGVSGLLQIQNIVVPTFEKNTTGFVRVSVQNVGSVSYYGFVSCDLTGGSGEKTTMNSTCSTVDSASSVEFAVPVLAGSAGTWKARCKSMGSLNPDCSAATIHDDKISNFTVFTKETYVVDVSGACSINGTTCAVRTTRGGCSACSINGVPCSKTKTVNNTDYFSCPQQPAGTYILAGSVITSGQCKPVDPAVKNTTVRCTGCGDGVVDAPEQCELPYTDNNAKCAQTESTCEGKVFAIRDKAGFCTPSCSCAYDEYTYSCTIGKCGAECADGQTRTVIINATNGGKCSCVQQCGSACVWNVCNCESSPVPVTSVPNVTVSHSPPSPSQTTPVTIMAVGSGATNVDIFVDGFVVKSCNSLPCSLSATYAPGTHSYYARASNSFGAKTDPDSGSKAFVIPGGAGGGNGTGLNVTSIILDVSASPDSPTETDTVLLTATAYGPKSFKQVNIFVDGVLKKNCANYASSQPCTYRSTYTAGDHDYYSTAVDITSAIAREPDTGTNTFTVTSGGSGGSNGGSSGNTSKPFGKCTVKFVNKSCSFDTATRRYDLYVSVAWDNGTHAHWNIEDNLGPKIYSKNFNHTEELAGPGVKKIQAQVHDQNDSTICLTTDQIYCGPGTTSGKDVDIIIDSKNVVPTGANTMRIIAIPYKNIDVFRLQSYVEKTLTVKNQRAEGNSTLAGVSGPDNVFQNKSYGVYTLATALEAGKNVSLIYTYVASAPGDYNFIAVANYSGQPQTYSKTIKVTDCQYTNSVLAKQIAAPNACKSFTTSCDVPTGWAIVESCSQQQLQPIPQNDQNPLILGVAFLLIVIIVAVGYKYRDKIKDKIDELRDRFSGGEERTTIDFES